MRESNVQVASEKPSELYVEGASSNEKLGHEEGSLSWTSEEEKTLVYVSVINSLLYLIDNAWHGNPSDSVPAGERSIGMCFPCCASCLPCHCLIGRTSLLRILLVLLKIWSLLLVHATILPCLSSSLVRTRAHMHFYLL